MFQSTEIILRAKKKFLVKKSPPPPPIFFLAQNDLRALKHETKSKNNSATFLVFALRAKEDFHT